MFYINRSFLIVFLCLFIFACSGSGASTSSSSDSGAVTTDALKSLTSIPDINIDNLDATASQASANVSVRYSSAPTEQLYSRSACEMRACVDQLKREVKTFQFEKCMLEAMEANTAFAVGDGAYTYSQIHLDESGIPGADEIYAEEFEDSEGDFDPEEDMIDATFYVRAGYNAEDDERLNVILCESVNDGEVSQTLELDIGVEDGAFSGTITDLLSGGYQLSVQLETEDPEQFQDGDTASIAGQFNDEFGKGVINLNIAKADSTITNEVEFSFQSTNESFGDSWTVAGYAFYDGQEGCATYEAAGTYEGEVAQDVLSPEDLDQLEGIEPTDRICFVNPEESEDSELTINDWVAKADDDDQCSFSSGGAGLVECFWFDSTGGTLNYLVHENETATYFDQAAAVSEHLDLIEPEISFVRDWDCTAPDGFTEIDANADEAVLAAMSECIAIEAEIYADAEDEFSSCEELEQQNDIEDDLEIELEEEDNSASDEETEEE